MVPAPARLIGKWHQGTSGKDEGEVWSLETDGDSLRVSRSLKQKTEEFECNIMGRDCDVKLSGRRAKVSLWFNGGALVELETRGADTVKRRFRTVSDGDTLEVEVIPINPAGKTEVVQLKRIQQVSAQKK
jgi:polyribonucleotide nucleotidyltransferase